MCFTFTSEVLYLFSFTAEEVPVLVVAVDNVQPGGDTVEERHVAFSTDTNNYQIKIPLT